MQTVQKHLTISYMHMDVTHKIEIWVQLRWHLKAALSRDPHLSSGEHVACQFDLGEVALADGLEQAVVADMWLLVHAGAERVPAAWQVLAARQFGGKAIQGCVLEKKEQFD